MARMSREAVHADPVLGARNTNGLLLFGTYGALILHLELRSLRSR